MNAGLLRGWSDSDLIGKFIGVVPLFRRSVWVWMNFYRERDGSFEMLFKQAYLYSSQIL